jgi:hypothetical protein
VPGVQRAGEASGTTAEALPDDVGTATGRERTPSAEDLGAAPVPEGIAVTAATAAPSALEGSGSSVAWGAREHPAITGDHAISAATENVQRPRCIGFALPSRGK